MKIKEHVALQYHLQYNHYPPVSLAFIPAVQKAIWHVRRGNYTKLIKLPNGKQLPVLQIIEELHLDGFLGQNYWRRAEGGEL